MATTISRLLQKIDVSHAEYRLFYRALLQKRPIILRSLQIVSPHTMPRETSVHEYVTHMSRYGTHTATHCNSWHIVTYVWHISYVTICYNMLQYVTTCHNMSQICYNMSQICHKHKQRETNIHEEKTDKDWGKSLFSSERLISSVTLSSCTYVLPEYVT